jgi:hypothetical protein
MMYCLFNANFRGFVDTIKPRNPVHHDTIDIPNTQIHDLPISWFVTDTAIKSGGAKLVLWVKIIEF